MFNGSRIIKDNYRNDNVVKIGQLMKASRTPNKYESHTYAFGGNTRIPQTVMCEEPVLQMREMNNSYKGKRSGNLLGRSQSTARPATGASKQSGASRLSKGAKAFYPNDYYERVGY